jgi:hypothetical protein
MKNLRLILKSWISQFTSLKNLVDTPLFEGDEKDVLAILHEAKEAGLFTQSDGGRLFLTEEGTAVATSKAGRRFSKKEAYEILDKIKESVISLNKDPKSPIVIEKIWLFGSLLNEAVADVGDIDIAFETKYRDWAGPELEMFDYIHQTYPGLVTTPFWRSFGIDSDFIVKKVFGRRRPTRVSLADIATLLRLCCPCAVYFQEGAPHQKLGPILPHHPKAKTVHAGLVERRTVSVPVSAGTLLPTSADILASLMPFDYEPVRPIIVTDPQPQDFKKFPLLHELAKLEDQPDFAICFDNSSLRGPSQPYPDIAAVTRRVTSDTGELRLTVDVSFLFAKKSIGFPDSAQLVAVGRILEILIGADVRRFSFQAEKSGKTFSLAINAGPGDKAPYQGWLTFLTAMITDRPPIKNNTVNSRRVAHDRDPLIPYRSKWRAFQL